MRHTQYSYWYLFNSTLLVRFFCIRVCYLYQPLSVLVVVKLMLKCLGIIKAKKGNRKKNTCLPKTIN
ncbi:uncharacterized protein BDW70DRAFT_142271 [Aspergillus foveolatus]|uniref:uncharacterized protein n=1 Tax=Aspergillus foveolatus TaxID=210207 RepID=UPI003CCD5D05